MRLHLTDVIQEGEESGDVHVVADELVHRASVTPKATTGSDPATTPPAGSGPRGGDGAATRLADLREQLALADGGYGNPALRRHHPTGLEPLDLALPGGGIPGGAITECFGDIGDGRSTLALQIVRQLLDYDATSLHSGNSGNSGRGERTILMVDPLRQWYPPALIRAGVPIDRLLHVAPARQTDVLWVIEQGLRSPAVLAVVAHVPWIHPAAARRLQLAAESGGGDTVGLLLRPLRELGVRGAGGAVQLTCRALPLSEAEWRTSDPHARRSRVTLHRCRGGTPGAMLDLTWRPDAPTTLPRCGPVVECTAVDSSLTLLRGGRARNREAV
ncbi:MAG: hypothetical protein AB7K09_15150 [Planctomycetota bacterium]